MTSTTSQRQIIPIFTYCALPLAVVLFVAAARQNVLIRLTTLLGYICVAVYACRFTTGRGVEADYMLGSFFGTNCFTAWWLLFYLELGEVRHREDSGSLVERSLLSRTYWLVTLWFNQRGIGWSVEVRTYQLSTIAQATERLGTLAQCSQKTNEQTILSFHRNRSSNDSTVLGRKSLMLKHRFILPRGDWENITKCIL